MQTKIMIRVIRFHASLPMVTISTGGFFFRELQHDRKSKWPPPKRCSKRWETKSERLIPFEDHSRPWDLAVGSIPILALIPICLVANLPAENYNHLGTMSSSGWKTRKTILFNFVGLSMVTGHIHMHSLN